MSRRIPASRAILTAALVLATAHFASAAEVVMVASERRGLGLGARLTTEVIAAARAVGLDGLYAIDLAMTLMEAGRRHEPVPEARARREALSRTGGREPPGRVLRELG